ncbi:MAG: AAA family ATPase, partial [bacterium]
MRSLHLRNLAIIRDVTLEFAPGFTVLTGETGAGKSILVDGLNLALGERADKALVRAGCEEASVEALFDPGGAGPLLAELGLEADADGLLLKRVVTNAGKSRCAVNGALAPLAALKRLGDRLVDLHGQHEHQLLLDPRHHAEFLDAFGGLLPLREEVRETYHGWRAARAELERLRAADAERASRLDLLAYQVNELEAARLAPGEEEALAVERLRLANSAKLGAALATAHDALLGDG